MPHGGVVGYSPRAKRSLRPKVLPVGTRSRPVRNLSCVASTRFRPFRSQLQASSRRLRPNRTSQRARLELPTSHQPKKGRGLRGGIIKGTRAFFPARNFRSTRPINEFAQLARKCANWTRGTTRRRGADARPQKSIHTIDTESRPRADPGPVPGAVSPRGFPTLPPHPGFRDAYIRPISAFEMCRRLHYKDYIYVICILSPEQASRGGRRSARTPGERTGEGGGVTSVGREVGAATPRAAPQAVR